MIDKLKSISLNENININYEALECITDISNGDLRKGILMLQNVKYSKNNISSEKIITKNDIYNISKYISQENMNKYILKIKSNGNILNIIKITEEIINNGFIFNSVINKIIQYVIMDDNLEDKSKANILFEISNIEKNINDGANEYIQLLKLITMISDLS
jgi:replication factor C subunit 2/4